MTPRRLALAMSAALVGVTLSGSALLAQDDEGMDDSGAAPAGTEVAVTLQEFAVLPDVTSVPAGSVTFTATNVGPMDPHELVVVKTDLAAGDLPTREDGSYDEDADGAEVLGEIEEFPVGETMSLTLDLEPGHYVLLCNLVEEEDGKVEAHYRLGMYTDFEVTAPAGTEVAVTLQEFAVLPDVTSVPAGSVTFTATNVGPMDPHELVVVKTDLAAGDLPTREDGSYDEDADGAEVLGEIEEFPVGETMSLTLDLEPGHYVLLCNLVEEEDGKVEAHYRLGMYTDFEVTG